MHRMACDEMYASMSRAGADIIMALDDVVSSVATSEERYVLSNSSSIACGQHPTEMSNIKFMMRQSS